MPPENNDDTSTSTTDTGDVSKETENNDAFTGDTDDDGKSGDVADKTTADEADADADGKAKDKLDSLGDKVTDKADAPNAPEKYEFKAPEGKEFTEEQTAELDKIVRDMDLTQAQADKFLALQLDTAKDAAEAGKTAFDNQVAEWRKEARADKEVGGENFDKAATNANNFINSFGNKKVVDLLRESGLNSHPEMLRMLHKAGAELAEDSSQTEGRAGDKEHTFATLAQSLYGPKS